LGGVEGAAPLVGVKAVAVAVHTGEDHRPARPADGVGHKSVAEQHTLLREAVDIGGAVDARAIGADCLHCVVVGEDEQDIGLASPIMLSGLQQTAYHAEKPGEKAAYSR
jgi:hypothetical protein